MEDPMQENSAVARALINDELLVGVLGKDVLRDAVDEILLNSGPAATDHACQFIDKFTHLHGLCDDSINPVVELLEVGGVARNRAAREIMTNMVTIMRQKITTLNQDQLTVLLDRSYSYLTVPELRPVAISTLEHMRTVREGMWTEIVQNGLTESPYIDLPVNIKRRIWRKERTAFEHEIEALVDKLPELQAPTLDTLMAMQPYEVRKVNNKSLKDLLHLAHGMGENNNVIIAEKLIDKAKADVSLAKKMAIANLFHDFIHDVPIREHNAIAHGKIIARETDKTQSLTYDRGLLEGVRDSLALMGEYPILVLLNTSTYSRDFVAECTVTRLRRLADKYSAVTDEQRKGQALAELSRDADLQNLTYICIFTMKLSALQSGVDIVQETETQHPTTVFYPLMIQEIAKDKRWSHDEFYREDAELPHEDLIDCVTSGNLERRVVSTYCRFLLQTKNMIGLRRFHLILDRMIPHCDAVEEVREMTLARGLCEFLSRKRK